MEKSNGEKGILVVMYAVSSFTILEQFFVNLLIKNKRRAKGTKTAGDTVSPP